MKTFTSYLFAILCFCAVLTGCKDDEEVAPKSTMTYDGKEYDLANGLIIEYGKYPPHEGNVEQLFLTSSGVKIRANGAKIDSIYGVGHAILFELLTNGDGELTVGDYSFDYSQGPYKVNSFVYSYAVFDADFVTRRQTKYEMISGTVKVAKDKDNYVITFDCIESNGKQVKGYFNGPIIFYDQKK
ncbi:hypothetical protein [Dyadobacter luticola]|uniref:Lipoprotein n=1 Tax=Dyadobacter luticola TaxID=1979387 RepID=A0A5R9KSP1_9BACT|nr:hypothetical protein [Dyadobacter luticola]TLU99106.1 hypothetical protein FEN17_21245 [Dyadobacter luticola]